MCDFYCIFQFSSETKLNYVREKLPGKIMFLSHVYVTYVNYGKTQDLYSGTTCDSDVLFVLMAIYIDLLQTFMLKGYQKADQLKMKGPRINRVTKMVCIQLSAIKTSNSF